MIEGRKFDAQGKPARLVDARGFQAIRETAGCIASQYSHYTAVDEIKVNGQLTLGENVADLAD